MCTTGLEKTRERRNIPLFQASATQQMAAYRLAQREPPKRANAALQPLAIE
jgi:hypothetical protein